MRIPGHLAISLLAIMSFPAAAKTVLVERWGVDVEGCGGKSDPCRTIDFAVDHASNNDRIRVGPGRYLEPPIHIAATGLKLESTHGARATIIDADPEIVLFAPDSMLTVAANKVQVGKRGKGFTIVGGFTGSDPDRASLEFLNNDLSVAKIEGNRLVDSANGMIVKGSKHQVRYNTASDIEFSGFRCVDCEQVAFRNNTAIDTSIGFNLANDNGLVQENVAENNDLGFIVNTGGTGLTVKNNVAQENDGNGMSTSGTLNARFEGNILTGNSLDGIDVGGSEDLLLKHNLAVLSEGDNNTGDGFEVTDSPGIKLQSNSSVDSDLHGYHFRTSATTTVSLFRNNNTYGTEESNGCGIRVRDSVTVSYVKTFFGAPPGTPTGSPGFDLTPLDDSDDDTFDSQCDNAGFVTATDIQGTATLKPNKTNTRRASRL